MHPVAAAALARRGAGRAGDHGRRRADRRLDHAPRPPGWTAGPVCLQERRADRAGRHLRRRSPPRLEDARRATLLVARARRARRRSSSRTRRASPTPRRSPPPDRTLDPRRPGGRARAVVRALHPHIGARLRSPTARSSASCARGVGDDGAFEPDRGASRRRPADGVRRLPARPRPAVSVGAGQPRAAAHASCGARWPRAPTPTAPCTARRAGWTRATARSPSASRSAPSSGAARSTGSSTSYTTRERSSRRCARRCTSASTSCCSSTASPRTRRSARPSSWPSRSRGHSVVNAVLRRVQREGVELPADDDARGRGDPPLAPAVARAALVGLARAPTPRARCWSPTTSRPSSRCASTRSPPPVAARRHPRRARAATTIVVDGPFDAFAHPGFAAGAFTPQSRAAQRVARVPGPAARRARARPVRGAGRQDDAPGGADGRPRRGRRRRAARGPRRGAGAHLRADARRERARRAAPTRSSSATRRASTASCSTRPAAAWAPCRPTPTCAGACSRRTSPSWPRSSGAMLARRAREPASGRAAGLRGLHALPGRGGARRASSAGARCRPRRHRRLL